MLFQRLGAILMAAIAAAKCAMQHHGQMRIRNKKLAWTNNLPLWKLLAVLLKKVVSDNPAYNPTTNLKINSPGPLAKTET